MYVSSKTYVLRLQRDFRDEVQFLPIHIDSCLVLSSEKQGEAKSGPKTKPGQRAVGSIAE